MRHGVGHNSVVMGYSSDIGMGQGCCAGACEHRVWGMELWRCAVGALGSWCSSGRPCSTGAGSSMWDTDRAQQETDGGVPYRYMGAGTQAGRIWVGAWNMGFMGIGVGCGLRGWSTGRAGPR